MLTSSNRRAAAIATAFVAFSGQLLPGRCFIGVPSLPHHAQHSAVYSQTASIATSSPTSYDQTIGALHSSKKQDSTLSAAYGPAALVAVVLTALQVTPLAVANVVVAMGAIFLGLLAHFQNLTAFPGPTQNPFELLTSLKDKSIQELLAEWADKYGSVYSIGPAVIITGSKNIDRVLTNSKTPFVLPGIAPDSGMSHDNEKVCGHIRKILHKVGVKKEGAQETIENASPAARALMDDVISQHGSALRSVDYMKSVAAPLATAMTGELVYSTSKAEDPARTAAEALEMQSLACKVAELFGQNILGMLSSPQNVLKAMARTRQFEAAMNSQLETPQVSGCPISKLKEAMTAGKISKDDVLQAGTSFTMTGARAIEDISGAVVWILAQPGNEELQKACRAEVDATLGGPREVVRSGEQLDKLHLLKAVFAETNRVHRSTFPSITVRNVEINGATLEKGSFVLSTGFIHEEKSKTAGPTAWAEAPRTFHPQGWITRDGVFDDKLFSKFSFFGKGAHRCPGKTFGVDGVVSVVAATLSHYDNICFPDGTDMSHVPPGSLNDARQNIIIDAELR